MPTWGLVGVLPSLAPRAYLPWMGPAGGALMTDHEYIELSSVAERAALLALMLHLLTSDPVMGLQQEPYGKRHVATERSVDDLRKS